MQGRPFWHTTFDFSLMPALRWLSIRCYKAPQGHATLATGCPGLEELELVRRGECLCGACVKYKLMCVCLVHQLWRGVQHGMAGPFGESPDT